MMATEEQRFAKAQALERDPNQNGNDSSLPSSEYPKPEALAKPELSPPPAGIDQEYEWVTGYKLLTIMTAVILVALLMLLDTSIVVTAIPRITGQFHSLADVGWYGSAYQLACAAIQPLTGRFYMNLNLKAMAQVGIAVGPLIGGALTEYSTWRWCFYINLPIGGLVAIMLFFVQIPEPIRKEKFLTAIKTLPGKLDLIGFVLFAPSAIELLIALQYGGNKFTWNSPQIIGLFCGAGVTFLAFLAWDYHKGDAAMIPFSIIRKRIVWSSSISYGLLMGQIFCASYYLPIYFQGVKGTSPLMSGVYVLPTILAHLFVALASGKISEYVLCRYAQPIVAVQNVLPAPHIPVATALVMFSQSFAGALCLSFADTIFTNSLSTLIPQYAPSVDPQRIINAGATGFRSYVSHVELEGVLVAYAKSCDRVFYLMIGMACGCFLVSCAMGLKDLRKKKAVSK
ncbi:major facilitator superfamily domain-containing protein, partial [Penicillium riverlandense]|uniref:major facilitator superfamily domain-containing protein n=1 Tax=Penicillium riverlandense TaxID=1903569 RepID=UPI0025495F74